MNDVIEANRFAIAKKLRLAREMAGLSQGQVAKLLNFHRPTISQLEAGGRRVSAEELVELARIYDVSINWLTNTESQRMDQHQRKLQLAARELAKLSDDDFERLWNLLIALRRDEEVKS